jgi:hypothetical protein
MLILSLIAAALLVSATGHHSDKYHFFVRLTVCLISTLMAGYALDKQKDKWAWLFCILALVFNPVMPPRLGKFWLLINLLTTLVFVISMVPFGLMASGKRQPIQKVWIKEKKAIMGWTSLAIALLYMGALGLWIGLTHVGPGVLQFGGDEPGTGGMAGTDEFEEVVPESEYKEQFSFRAVMFSAFGFYTLWQVRKMWKKRKGEEEYWNGVVKHSDAAERINKDWPHYREDFKQWIEENHPKLYPQTVPRNESTQTAAPHQDSA